MSQDSEFKKEVISDSLGVEFELKESETKEKVKRKNLLNKKRILFPNRSDFWDIFNQYWLMKQVEKLGWNKSFADHSIEKIVNKIFQKMSFNAQYQILYVSDISGGIRALPGIGKNVYFLIAPSFISRNQLKIEEIMAIMLEELTFVRKQAGVLPLYEFSGKTLNHSRKQMEFIKKFVTYYDDFIFNNKTSLKNYFETVRTVKKFINEQERMNLNYLKLLEKLGKDPSFLAYKPGVKLVKGWINATN